MLILCVHLHERLPQYFPQHTVVLSGGLHTTFYKQVTHTHTAHQREREMAVFQIVLQTETVDCSPMGQLFNSCQLGYHPEESDCVIMDSHTIALFLMCGLHPHIQTNCTFILSAFF